LIKPKARPQSTSRLATFVTIIIGMFIRGQPGRAHSVLIELMRRQPDLVVRSSGPEIPALLRHVPEHVIILLEENVQSKRLFFAPEDPQAADDARDAQVVVVPVDNPSGGRGVPFLALRDDVRHVGVGILICRVVGVLDLLPLQAIEA